MHRRFEIETPALLLDESRLTHNLTTMSRRMKTLGVDLRPHLKTAKSAEVARLAVQGHGGGITVSTVAETEYFAGNGFLDITLATGVHAGRLGRLRQLFSGGARVTLILDSIPMADMLTGHDDPPSGGWPVLIEVECGAGRAGTDPEGSELLTIAERLHLSAATDLRGVLTHGGHSYAARRRPQFEAAAEDERTAVTRAATRLRSCGFPCETTSVGSTPSMRFATNLTGVTEARPGVYMFGDLYQCGLGVCEESDIAISVLATVIGHQPSVGAALIDAGALALSKDRSAETFADGLGYGPVCDLGGARMGSVAVGAVHQEHGFLRRMDGGAFPFERFPVGSQVRVLPHHACMMTAPYDRFHVIDATGQVGGVWHKTRGW